MGPAAEWVTQRDDAYASTAPPLGGRREWLGYAYETTGFGSVELSGDTPVRVTIVRPGDDIALRRHHRLVRAGRLRPLLRRSHLDTTHVLDRDALRATGAHDRTSWLATTRSVARLCATDDQVALVSGPALRALLWASRHDPGSVGEALHELAEATRDLAREQAAFRSALASRDVAGVRLEALVLAEVRREWGATAAPTPSS